MQRLCDIFFSGAALIILAPLLVPIVIVLRFSGEGEIFFLQDRIGKQAKPFKLFKFATMLKNSPQIGTGTVTVKNDPRVLPIGKFLRKTKINELPQLLNIFLGDMSFVGPRPLTRQTFSAYDDAIQLIVQSVPPGLTGIGSIIFRCEEEILAGSHASFDFYKHTIAPYKGQVEEWYVENRNLYVYFLLILITGWVVFIPKSNIVWKLFKSLPEPPFQLKEVLNYPVRKN